MNTWTLPGYTESSELGSGASGRVVLAVHEETGVPVAVKYLSESLRTRPGFVRDFRTEARLLGGLESPFVTELYEYVEGPDGAAIVMELVDGVSLRAVLKREDPLGPEAALVILKGSLLGLADAHRVGVVHRDYKPENVLVAPDGSSKLVDFGIAVDTGTSAGVAGTPSYMAPEQWTGAPASPAADVYAAAATFFECLTGHKPYRGDNLAALALQHVDAPVPADEVPEAVRELVRRGLAKDPEDRPAEAEAFVRELEAAALAGYGPEWEERGRGRLAALVALLPLLLPSARSTPRTTTDTARTVLHQEPGRGGAQAWLPGRSGMLVSGAALLLGAVLTFGLQHTPGDDTGQVAQALATTSADASTDTAAPPSPTGSASPSPTPSDSAGQSPSPTLSPSDAVPTPTDASSSPATTDGTTGGTTETTEPGGETTSPAPTTTSPAPVVAPAVKDVTVSGFRQTGPVTATATISIVTDGTGPFSLTVSWFAGDSSRQLGAPDGTSQTFERSGATQYTLTVDHAFRSTGCYWAVQATTTPTSADGGASQQLLTRRCDIR
ncbi:protein kinase [Streptomyces caniscabiei]|uniref:non-specific serine/threonine protein kinase n=1 Tax=Streptomyces caniscabiei TaxID=2746961 RepID=A0A927L6H0_9ACTN|nr:serine/threonine-protein kinase [Streptomyces caniscabiei]MBD9726472.1 protein kinase [Streptomyces caniscabiei]MDX3511671.1 protein kinase [Streptomyces caniscabiei]MDX3719220.1 protein kinase [Streptomyces caniscabiei]WEO29635.1 protein kinase [Streptomyces caniscabiei]